MEHTGQEYCLRQMIELCLRAIGVEVAMTMRMMHCGCSAGLKDVTPLHGGRVSSLLGLGLLNFLVGLMPGRDPGFDSGRDHSWVLIL